MQTIPLVVGGLGAAAPCLAKNLNNSLLLPYDVMKIIYEYADPLISIRKQINNKEYDLDEIMYKRMKKFIIDRVGRGLGGLGGYYLYYSNMEVIIHKHNIHNRYFKEYLLNAREGYKHLFLSEHKLSSTICGLRKCCMDYRKYLMICDLVYANVYKVKNTLYDKKYKMKNVYKKWLKL